MEQGERYKSCARCNAKTARLKLPALVIGHNRPTWVPFRAAFRRRYDLSVFIKLDVPNVRCRPLPIVWLISDLERNRGVIWHNQLALGVCNERIHVGDHAIAARSGLPIVAAIGCRFRWCLRCARSIVRSARTVLQRALRRLRPFECLPHIAACGWHFNVGLRILPGELVKNFARFLTPLDHRLLRFASILNGPHQVDAILPIEFLILNLRRVYDLRTLCSKRNIEICLATILTTSKFNDAVLTDSVSAGRF